MTDLLEESVYKEIVGRLDNLSHDVERQWGKMTVAQMMAHCSTAMGAATGRNPISRSFMGRLSGAFVKKSWVTGDKPYARNSPTDRGLIIKGDHDFEVEKARLGELITLFHKEGRTLTIDSIHPFFGKLTTEEWCNLTTRHLDHHLRQFGT